MGITIELVIPRSSSPSLPRALSTARKFEGFIEPDDPKQPYRLIIGADEMRARHRALEGLFETVRGWKGAQLLINGKTADAYRFREILSVMQCSDGRDAAVLPDEYCDSSYGSGWGCRYLRVIQAGLPSSAYEMDRGSRYWFQFGRFSEDMSTWTIDKTELAEAVAREANSTHADTCPFFSLETARSRIDALPSELELGEGSSWETVLEDQCNGSTIQQSAVGVIPRHLGHDSGRGLSFELTAAVERLVGRAVEKRNIPDVSFEDIGGVDEILDMVREIIELPLRHPALFRHLGIAPHKGILLYGPPGCGKTLIAKAIANDIDAHFISIRGPELFSKYVGQSEENLREVFGEARAHAPSIIFFDEIDSIAQKRSAEESVRHESVFVNQLLTLMDGMETYENVCVIASTNRLELLDEAVRRPGRFDYVLEIRHPNSDGVLKILGIHTRNMPLAQSVDLFALARAMDGFTGAEIAFVAREAAYNCLRRSAELETLLTCSEEEIDFGQYLVEQEDFELAVKMVRVTQAEAAP